MKVVLYRPEIPQNTGNIARTCSLTGSSLMLIPPVGFFLHSSTIRRSSVRYLQTEDIEVWNNGEDKWLEEFGDLCWMFSTRGQIRYDQVVYGQSPILLFGSESLGLPDLWIKNFPQRTVYIPLLQKKGSLNLSNAAAIAIYEVLRQRNFLSSY
ncbi:TrmH family RNA methyltransferase [Candidatus Similichlamydia epinepheli]|uniref:TrmH family RNA methyltransferase n=1 Tax=Candidatus Similichlamydia epinepheli TaxID=1903953 RepID=UPI000D37D57A|nr:TrmH family RNA methyltransferase [Candidatus Similichlamydia epinepheli]